MNTRKTYITGISTLCSVATGYPELAAGLAGEPTMSRVKSFEFHELERETPCFRLKSNFVPADILGKAGLRTKDPATKMVLAAAEMGFKERYEKEPEDMRPGLVIGTAFGSVQSIGDFLSDSIVNGVNAVNPMLFANTVINSPTGNVNIRFGVKSLSSTVSTTFNAGIDAIIYACDYIQSGYSDALCAGGLEEVSYYSLLGLERMGLLSNAGTLKPFARDADGTVMGEGCALFMIESDTRVSGSGATALAQITGYASAFDPNSGRAGYNPSGESARYAIEQALLMAGISPDAIDFIASSANGISSGDALEASVLKAIFGSRPVAAYKAKTGECYGASAALSLACAVSDMKNNRITGTGLSYPVFDDINCVAETLENKKSEHVLVTSFSCDGNCAALVIKNC